VPLLKLKSLDSAVRPEAVAGLSVTLLNGCEGSWLAKFSSVMLLPFKGISRWFLSFCAERCGNPKLRA